jgi:glycosyltransferase involved in cell wall biosynthesis
MNELCLIAQGDYIAVMHGDDICFPNRLSLELNFLEKNSPIDVVFGKFVEVNEAGAIIRTVGENSYPVNHLDVELSMYFSNCICHPTVMFKRSILNKFCYNSEFRVTEDYKFWTDILIGGGKFGFLEKELIKYRIHLNQGSSKFNSKMLNEVDIIRNEYVSLSNPTFSKIINLMNSGQICSVDEIMKIFKDTLFEDNERRWFSDRLDHWVNLGVKSGNLTFNDILIYALKMGPLRKVNVKNIIHFILAKL